MQVLTVTVFIVPVYQLSSIIYIKGNHHACCVDLLVCSEV